MSLRIAGILLALCFMADIGVAAAKDVEVEVDLDENSLLLEFSEPMRVIQNVEMRALVTSIPAREYICIWQDDIELACMVEGPPLPSATPVTIMLADGLQTATGVSLGVRRFEAETRRPELRASIEGWEGGRPHIVLESGDLLEAQQVAEVLRLRGGDREWRVPSLRPLPLEHRTWLKSIFALELPDDLAGDVEIALRVVPGLRTPEGPLPGEQDTTLLRFIDREPFRLRSVLCAGRQQEGRHEVRDGLVEARCVPGEPIRLMFSSPLDDAGRSAFVAALPAAISVEKWQGSQWWPGMRGNDGVHRRPAGAIDVRFDVPKASVTFALDSGQRDDGGRPLLPVRLRIGTSEARPQLRASAGRVLLADPARDPIRSINAPPVEMRVDTLADALVSGIVHAPDTRGRTGSVNAEIGTQALQAGGWTQWHHEATQVLEVAAPQFELSAYATSRELVAWATEWNGGTAVVDADVELLLFTEGQTLQRIVAGRTGRDGLLTLRLPEDFRMPVKKRGVWPPRWLLRARAGDRLAVLSLGHGYALNLGEHRIDEHVWGVVDRPVYRAGDTVRYRLWLRDGSGGRLHRVNDAAPIELDLVHDDEDKTLRSWSAPVDEFGAITGEERVPQHAVDGTYCIRATRHKKALEKTCFFVGTYRAQDLWVEAKAEDRVLRDGETFAVDISAGYYSGGGAANAALGHISTMLTGLPLSTAYPAYADYQFIDVSRGVGGDGVGLLDESRNWGVLDRDGKTRLSLPLKFKFQSMDETEADLPAFGRLQLTAQVKLEAREGTYSNAAQARYARYPRYVGLRIVPRWFDAKTPLRLEGVVIDAEGHAQAGAGIEITTEYLPESRPRTDGEPGEEPAREHIATCRLTAGIAKACDIPRRRTGRYLFTARSGDAAPVEIERYVWAGDSDDAAEGPVELELLEALATPEAPARLLLKHPYGRADALIVVESGGTLLHSRAIPIDTAAYEWLLPLGAEGRNQVRVHALVRRRGDAAIDPAGLRLPTQSQAVSLEVKVPLRARSALLELAFDHARAAPGQPVRIRLHNRGGTPRVATLTVIDDALRALGAEWWALFDPHGETWLGMPLGDWSNRPFLAGHRDWNKGEWQWRLPWPDAQHTADSSVPSASTDDDAHAGASTREAPAPAYGYSGDGELDRIEVVGSRINRADVFSSGEGPSPVLVLSRKQIETIGLNSAGDLLPDLEGKPIRNRPGRYDSGDATRDGRRARDARALFGARLRSDFAETAQWLPEVRLAPGETRVIEFVVPDNLARWRAVAWSSDADDGFEMAEATLEVGLPLEVRLQAPARLYPGDRADLVANVRQTGERAADVDATLQVEALGAEATGTLALAPRGQAILPLRIAPVDAQVQTGSRSITAVAAARDGEASDAISASIELSSPIIEGRKVQAGWLGASTLDLEAPTLPGTASDATLRVSLLPGADAWMHRWIGDLQAYPHRCWEQILSRGVAAAIAIERGDVERWPDAKAVVKEALENATVFQSDKGDFGYFADEFDDVDESRPQYALTAYSVRALRLLRGMGYDIPADALRRAEDFLKQHGKALADSKSSVDEAAFVVSGLERADGQVLDALWRQWSIMGLPARIATTRAMLAGEHPQADEAVARLRKATKRRGETLRLQSGEQGGRWMSTDLREQCEFIGLLFQFPESGAAPLRRALIGGLGDLYAGGIAQVDTQTGASCLVALRTLDKRKTGDSATLEIAHGDARGTLRLEAGQPAQTWEHHPNPEGAREALRLTPRIKGDAVASYIAEIGYSEDAREASSTAIGFSLRRRHEVLREGGWKALDKDVLREGDWVRITLMLDTTAARHFVAITDAVPGGLRPTDLAVSGVAGLDLQQVSDEGSDWFRTRRLDPQAPKFYAEFLPAGKHEIHYFARAGNSGDFLAAPALAELMYGEATRARTAAARIGVEPAQDLRE